MSSPRSLERDLEAERARVSDLIHRVNNLLMGISGCAEIALAVLDERHDATPYVSEIYRAALEGVEAMRGETETAAPPPLAGSRRESR